MRAVHQIAAAFGKLFEGGLILVLRLFDIFAHALEGLHKADKFVVQFAAFVGDGERVLVLLFVAPDIGDGAQGGEQGAGADQHNAFVETFLKQAVVVLQRQQVGGLDRDKHKHEIQRVHAVQLAVLFERQAFDVAADAGGVVGQFALGFVGRLRLGVAHIGGERDFAVDDDLFVVGQVYQYVGLQAAGAAVFFAARGGGLHDVFAAFHQAGIFQYGF